MPTYISLIQFTGQGIENIKESPARLDAAKTALEDAGGKLIGFYLTMGRYDGVLVMEGPDDEALAKFLLAAGAQGNISTETLRAFPEDVYRRLIDDLP